MGYEIRNISELHEVDWVAINKSQSPETVKFNVAGTKFIIESNDFTEYDRDGVIELLQTPEWKYPTNLEG